MKIHQNSLELETLEGLIALIESLGLQDSLKLSKPITDLAGNALVKEGVTLKSSTLKKLEDLGGMVKPVFHLRVDATVIDRVRSFLTESALSRLERRENGFIKHLFAGVPLSRMRSTIRNAFVTDRFTLEAFEIAMVAPEFFEHLADRALVPLGLAYTSGLQIPMLRRYSFLAGFCLDLPFALNGEWREIPEDDAEERRRLLIAALQTSRKLSIAGLERVFPGSFIGRSEPTQAKAPPNTGVPSGLDENGYDRDDTDEDASDAYCDELSADQIDGLASVLKIARFVLDTVRASNSKSDYLAEELVYMLAYNAGRGYFQEEIIEPILIRYREYEEHSRSMMKIAFLESKCPFKNSAWAYPKPRPGQVLCRERHFDCPRLISGWDVTIVSPENSFGRIGTKLEAGNYPKCALEDELSTRPQRKRSRVTQDTVRSA